MSSIPSRRCKKIKAALAMSRSASGYPGLSLETDALSLIRQAYGRLNAIERAGLCALGFCAIEPLIDYLQENPQVALRLGQAIVTGENWWLVLIEIVRAENP